MYQEVLHPLHAHCFSIRSSLRPLCSIPDAHAIPAALHGNDCQANQAQVQSFENLIEVCVKCGKLPQALETYHAMESEGYSPNILTLDSMVVVFGKLGMWQEAIQVIYQMKAQVTRKGSHPSLH